MLNINNYTSEELQALYLGIQYTLEAFKCERNCQKCSHKQFCNDLMLESVRILSLRNSFLKPKKGGNNL